MKLLVVGWDAATHRHLQSMQLPFWDGLDHRGRLYPERLFRGSYISTGNAWTTMTTGVSFEEHRIFGFVHGPYVGHPLEGPVKWIIRRSWIPRIARRTLLGLGLGNIATAGGRGASPQSTDVPYKRVWEYLEDNALVFGLPVTYPVWNTNGILVSGVPGPKPSEASKPLVSPTELQPKVFDDEFTGYHVDMTSPLHDPDSSKDEYCEAHVAKTEKVGEKFLDLYRNHDHQQDFEFGFLMLRSIDDVLHATSRWELMERIYRATDSVTERIVNEIDPDAVMVLSDHGMYETPWFRREKAIEMDHDTTQGVWGGTDDFDLENHMDVTPAILDHFGVAHKWPERQEAYDIPEERIDGEAVKARLADLGYV